MNIKFAKKDISDGKERFCVCVDWDRDEADSNEVNLFFEEKYYIKV